MVNRVCTTLKEHASWDSKMNESRTLMHYADVHISFCILMLCIWKQRSPTNCIVSIHCAPMKSCIQNTQFVSSTWLLVQDHSVRLYFASSIIGPVKAGIMFALLLWQLNFIHYLELSSYEFSLQNLSLGTNQTFYPLWIVFLTVV